MGIIAALPTRVVFDSDAVQTVFNFSFSGGYIDRSHVKAYHTSPAGVVTAIAVTPGMFIGPFQLSFTPAPAVGKLTIYRQTPKLVPLVDFVDGARISESSLDIVAKQSVFIAAENSDDLSQLYGVYDFQTKLQEHISITDGGGAIPNGYINTTVIQAAIGLGRSVYVPEGVWYTDTLSLPPGTRLYGAGPRSVIKANSLVNGGSGAGQRLLDIRASSDVIVENLTLDLSGFTGAVGGVRAVLAINSNKYAVRNCRIITPGAAVASVTCYDYDVENNNIYIQSTSGAAMHDGIIDQWWGSYDMRIRNNNLHCNGIGLWPILVTGQATDNSAAAVSKGLIEGNSTYDSVNAGIWVMGRNGGAVDFRVISNLVSGTTGLSGGYGMAFTDCSGVVAVGNHTKNTALAGIRAFSENTPGTVGPVACQKSVISGNCVDNANTSALANSDAGSAISVTDASRWVTVGSNQVTGTTHRYAVFVGANALDVQVSGWNMQRGVSGKFISLAPISSNVLFEGTGTYTPTLYGDANVAAANAYPLNYRRDGDVVTVSGRFDFTPAVVSTDTQIGFSLPIASDFTNVNQLSGVATSSFALVGSIYADFTNNRATLRLQSTNTVPNVMSFSFQYQIL